MSGYCNNAWMHLIKSQTWGLNKYCDNSFTFNLENRTLERRNPICTVIDQIKI